MVSQVLIIICLAGTATLLFQGSVCRTKPENGY